MSTVADLEVGDLLEPNRRVYYVGDLAGHREVGPGRHRLHDVPPRLDAAGGRPGWRVLQG